MIEIIEDYIEVRTGCYLNADKDLDVVILLDESGSMGPYRSEVISTFNEYVNDVRDTAKTISLYTFDSKGIREKLYKEDTKNVQSLTEQNYCPDAATPLYDAMGKVINKFRDTKGKVQFVVHTDGAENNSEEFTYKTITAIVDDLTEKGWLFVFLGEGLVAQKQFKDFKGMKVNYSADNRGATMQSLGATTQVYSCSTIADTKVLNNTEIDIDDQVKKEKTV